MSGRLTESSKQHKAVSGSQERRHHDTLKFPEEILSIRWQWKK